MWSELDATSALAGMSTTNGAPSVRGALLITESLPTPQ
jgi:hypothetical protein